ncbi:hypothetical protein IE978_11945 [Klebsiella pneumoniae]|uniref:Uncharacterized protein n=1 Tax=Klebsiella pneumoniae TaxID=573 RepID=A0A927E2U9_KLEPN|nr:hypothetical protein [Klebsiella pneumoniae]
MAESDMIAVVPEQVARHITSAIPAAAGRCLFPSPKSPSVRSGISGCTAIPDISGYAR